MPPPRIPALLRALVFSGPDQRISSSVQTLREVVVASSFPRVFSLQFISIPAHKLQVSLCACFVRLFFFPTPQFTNWHCTVGCSQSTTRPDQLFRQPDWRQCASFCTRTRNQQVTLEACSSEVQDIHKKITNEIQGKRTVPLSLLRTLLEQCKVPEDVALAFQVLQDYRIYRSSKARVKQNFNENIAVLVVLASLRTRAYDVGLKALWKHNVYGLSPCLGTAHLFLSHAKHEKDLDLMQKTFKVMTENSLMPTSQTADIMIRLCKEKDDLKLMLDLAREFLENGVRLSPPVFDILISTAANFGSIEETFKVQSWREEAGLNHTIASVFALAKAHILQGKPHAAVELISTHCQDTVKVNKYLTMLVRAWPSELLSRKEEIKQEDSFSTLRENVLSLVEALSKKYYGLSIDAAEDFAKGKVNFCKDDGLYEAPRFSAVS